MKTETQIKHALDYHSKNMLSLTDEQKKNLAMRLGWSLEYLKGYAEGVEWAYKWMLKNE